MVYNGFGRFLCWKSSVAVCDAMEEFCLSLTCVLHAGGANGLAFGNIFNDIKLII